MKKFRNFYYILIIFTIFINVFVKSKSISSNDGERNIKKQNPKKEDPLYAWVEFNGSIPNNAITTKNGIGETIAVCRGEYENKGVHPGYVDETTKKCNIGYGGHAYELSNFEILTAHKNKLIWKEWDSSMYLGKSLTGEGYKYVDGGYDSIEYIFPPEENMRILYWEVRYRNEPLYVCKITDDNGGEYFGKTSRIIEGANYALNENEYKKNNFSILIEA